ncbi:MAG: DUF58 domain-containing protein [Gammaproteobacteria bacterium]
MIEEFHYQIPWRTSSAHPGRHASLHSGGEHEFHGHAPLLSRPEPHNIDVHASLLDPFQQFVVRTFRQRGRITVNLVADLSASMGFQNKMETLARFTEIAAFSAYRNGDYFAFIGCGHDLIPKLHYPPRWYKGGTPELAGQLRAYRPDASNSRSLLKVADYCPRHRSLIFLVSDFHFPLHETAEIFDSLLKHDVIPVVLWHPGEYEDLPEWGLVRLQDLETGQDRQMLMRPALKQKIITSFADKQEKLKRLSMRYGRRPFFLNHAFQTDQITRYFYEQ